jgi:hypothetical protein
MTSDPHDLSSPITGMGTVGAAADVPKKQGYVVVVPPRDGLETVASRTLERRFTGFGRAFGSEFALVRLTDPTERRVFTERIDVGRRRYARPLLVVTDSHPEAVIRGAAEGTQCLVFPLGSLDHEDDVTAVIDTLVACSEADDFVTAARWEHRRSIVEKRLPALKSVAEFAIAVAALV